MNKEQLICFIRYNRKHLIEKTRPSKFSKATMYKSISYTNRHIKIL